MIASLMAYLALVSLVATVAALLAESGLRRLGAATRWAWVGAMLLGPVLLAVARLEVAGWRPGERLPVVAPPTLDLQGLLDAVAPSSASVWVGIDRALALAWACGSLFFFVVLARSGARLARERRTWTLRAVRRARVFVSDERGPAVAGVARPWIVLPEWVLDLPADQLRMVLRHEGEHLRAGDSRLVLLGLVLAGLTPWNPLGWWQLRRLRTAVEVDCDRRVLARDGDVRAYGAALLTVAASVTAERQLAFAAFSESARTLRTRIVAMTARRSRVASGLGALLLAAAAGVGIQACELDSPTAPAAPAAETTRTDLPGTSAPASSLQSVNPPQAINPNGPTFTPFSVAPGLTNRADVVAAFEREYPPLLRDAGVGGQVEVWLHVDERGVLDDAVVKESSGHVPLDRAALAVARVMRFKPALNRDRPVAVWVAVPITFLARPK